MEKTTLLLLNADEARKFTEKNSVEDAIRTLLKHGATNVCITDGEKGATGSDGKDLYHCPAVPETNVRDATGAGDAFCTGATWALLQGKDLSTALKAGSINAASVVRSIGAQGGLLTETHMESTLRECTLTVHVQTL